MRSVLRTKTRPNIVLFYICYGFIIACSMLREVLFLGNVVAFLYQIVLAILAFTAIVAISRLPRKKIFIFVILFFIAIAVKITSGTNTMITLVLLVTASRGISLDDVIRYDLMIKIPLMIIVPILYFVGVTNVNVHYREDGTMRHSMGFSNPNIFSAYIVSIVMEIIYLHRDKFRTFDLIFIACMIGLIYFFSDSQTSMMCCIGLFVVVLYEQIRKKRKPGNNGLIMFLFRNSFSILLIISLAASCVYSESSVNSQFYRLDKSMNGRIKNISVFLNEYEIRPLGQKIELVSSMRSKKTGEAPKALDNLYVYSLLSYGWVTVFALCILMNRYIQSAEKNGTRLLVYTMVILFVGGLMERFCLDIQYNIFLLYFSNILYGAKDGVAQYDENNGKVVYGK